MDLLLKSTKAYQTISAQCGALKHAYLLLFPDEKNLRFALRTFAPLFFETPNDKNADAKYRRNSLIERECFADCLFFPETGKKFTADCAAKVEEECALRPVEGDKKLFVIGDFSEATKEAQNKLLKVLEEPPAGVCFLLGASSSFSVLPTVLSRVEKLEIPPFSEAEIVSYLQRTIHRIATDDALLSAAACGGIAGRAFEMCAGGYLADLMQTAYALCFATSASLPALVKSCSETKYKKELLSLLKIVFSDAVKCRMTMRGETDAFRGKQFDENVARISSQYSYSAMLKAQEILSEAEKQLYFNGVFPQIIEIALSKIIRLRGVK